MYDIVLDRILRAWKRRRRDAADRRTGRCNLCGDAVPSGQTRCRPCLDDLQW